MPIPIEDKLVVAVSARTLFNLEAAHDVYTRAGLPAYREFQREHESEPLDAGVGMALVRALLSVQSADIQPLIEVVVVSRHDLESDYRVFNSLEHWDLPISRVSFTG